MHSFLWWAVGAESGFSELSGNASLYIQHTVRGRAADRARDDGGMGGRVKTVKAN